MLSNSKILDSATELITFPPQRDLVYLKFFPNSWFITLWHHHKIRHALAYKEFTLDQNLWTLDQTTNYTNIWLIVYISLKYQLITREHKCFLGFLKDLKVLKQVQFLMFWPLLLLIAIYLLEAASENIKTIFWTYIFELQSGHWYIVGQGQG